MSVNNGVTILLARLAQYDVAVFESQKCLNSVYLHRNGDAIVENSYSVILWNAKYQT